MNDSMDDWRMKLRSGELQTRFSHYTVLAEGDVGELRHGFSCRPGRAFMGMKTWASTTDECVNMVQRIGEDIGFSMTGEIQIYVTEPERPPTDKPFGYDINFTPFDREH